MITTMISQKKCICMATSGLGRRKNRYITIVVQARSRKPAGRICKKKMTCNLIYFLSRKGFLILFLLKASSHSPALLYYHLLSQP